MDDPWSAFENGVTRLLEQMGREHTRYADVLTLQSRLLENISATRTYGDTETRRAERAQIVEALDQLSVEAVGRSFNEWCEISPGEEFVRDGLDFPPPPLSPRRRQPMRNRRLAFAFVVSTVLSLLVGLLSNLAATYMAPSLVGQSWLIYGALIATFAIALPVSIYLFLRGLPETKTMAATPVVTQPSVRETVPLPVSSESGKMSSLPSKPYRELVGRDILMGEIMAALRDPAGKWIVAIDGMGGIGKTAVAREVVDCCLAERLFDVAVWEPAPREQPGLEDRGKGKGTLTYETTLDAIARQLGALGVLRLKGTEKETRVRALLQMQRVLVVLDNLETAKESQNEIARRLHSLLNPSKALLTSRHRFEGDLYAIHLTGLDEDGALRYIRQEARDKGIDRVTGAEIGELKEIAQSTGGSPLALKLVVGQLGYLPLERVLGQLREVRLPERDSDEDDYVRFYKGIFFPSWQLLSDNGKKLLISMAHFAPGVGGTFEAVKATSDLADGVLTDGIKKVSGNLTLCKLNN